jgi:hypothetical protein
MWEDYDERELAILTNELLSATDATAISIVPAMRGPGFVFRAGLVVEGASTHWVNERYAAIIVRRARKLAGPYPDKAVAERKLQEAAHVSRQILTPHLIAYSRARIMAMRLVGILREMTDNGQLAELNMKFRKRRMKAEIAGASYLNHSAMLARLRRELIRRLSAREPPCGPGLFEAVLSTDISRQKKIS